MFLERKSRDQRQILSDDLFLNFDWIFSVFVVPFQLLKPLQCSIDKKVWEPLRQKVRRGYSPNLHNIAPERYTQIRGVQPLALPGRKRTTRLNHGPDFYYLSDSV